MAGEALTMLSDQGESNATIIFKASDTIVEDLTSMVLLEDRELEEMEFRITAMRPEYRIGCITSAAEILENLYIRYTKDDDHLKKLTEAMKDVLPKLADKIAPGDPTFSFAGKLKELVEGYSEQATAIRLRLLKITSRMIKSLTNLEGGRVRADLEGLMQSLSEASKNMLQMEGFMIF
ncbi:hypothetical protein ABZP36_033456 [Zizania latifolia]